MPAGRPTKYNDEVLERAQKLALLGLTDEQMCDIVGVARATWAKWKNDHPEFSDTLKRAKADADAKVASALYRRALGYTVTETREVVSEGGEVHELTSTKELPSETTAGIFWLKNRQPHLFRDKKEIDVTTKSLEEIVAGEDEADA